MCWARSEQIGTFPLDSRFDTFVPSLLDTSLQIPPALPCPALPHPALHCPALPCPERTCTAADQPYGRAGRAAGCWACVLIALRRHVDLSAGPGTRDRRHRGHAARPAQLRCKSLRPFLMETNRRGRAGNTHHHRLPVSLLVCLSVCLSVFLSLSVCGGTCPSGVPYMYFNPFVIDQNREMTQPLLHIGPSG